MAPTRKGGRCSETKSVHTGKVIEWGGGGVGNGTHFDRAMCGRVNKMGPIRTRQRQKNHHSEIIRTVFITEIVIESWQVLVSQVRSYAKGSYNLDLCGHGGEQGSIEIKYNSVGAD